MTISVVGASNTPGKVGYAIIKNLIWTEKKYPGLTVVGGDSAENPNNTLIMTPEMYTKYGKAIEDALLKIEYDNHSLAGKIKSRFGISGYIRTIQSDFSHTYSNMEKAKVDTANDEHSYPL